MTQRANTDGGLYHGAAALLFVVLALTWLAGCAPSSIFRFEEGPEPSSLENTADAPRGEPDGNDP